MLKVQITSNGEKIGIISTKDFMAYMDRPNRFLSQLIQDFNTQKEVSGEPERAESILAK